MPQPVLLRPMVAQDAPQLQRISQKARDRYRALPGFVAVADTPAVALERFLTGSGWVAESNGACLGFALTKPVDDLWFLDNISTLPEAAGLGLGGRLLTRVLESAAEAGHHTLALTTFRTPPWNGPWFRRFGFAPLPQTAIGPDLAAILARQAGYLDPSTRETLARELTAT